jgi:hypothetical protein
MVRGCNYSRLFNFCYAFVSDNALYGLKKEGAGERRSQPAERAGETWARGGAFHGGRGRCGLVISAIS